VSVGARFDGISVSFGGRPVLKGVTFSVSPGQRTAFVGPNGGGKTTLVRILLDLLTPGAGRVAFVDGGGHEVPRPRIGYLSQRSTLTPFAPVTGLDLVGLSLDPRAGFAGRVTREREAREALERAGLAPELRERPVGKLSGGQRQRVLLARALAGRPPLLVLDEPDTALDAEGLMTLRRVIAEELEAGTTILLVSHDTDSMGGTDAVFRVDGLVTEEPAEGTR
jgi:ABC-type Mn2+/Zn2+ transport system ATPase subunit